MTLEALSIWKSTFEDDIPPTKGPEWPDSFTDWYTARFNSPLLELPGLTIVVPPLPMTFGEP